MDITKEEDGERKSVPLSQVVGELLGVAILLIPVYIVAKIWSWVLKRLGM